MARTRSTIDTPESDSLFGAAFLSAILHVLALVGAFVVWPHISPPAEMPSDMVPVDLLTVADVTNIQAQAEQVEEKPVEQPPPEQTPPEQPPEQQQALAEETPPPPPVPEEPAPDAEATKVEPPKPEPPKPEPPTPEPPKPEPERYAMKLPPRPKPKAEPKKDDFDLDKIMKGLSDEPKEKKPAPSKAVAERAVRGAGAQTALTASEIDALKAKLAKCWNPPNGAPDPAALVFRVRFNLNEDGTVSGAPQLLDKGGLGDPYFRAAADSAIRAVHMCGPYTELPPEKYAGTTGWNEVTIEFDPTKMSGY